MWLFFGISVGLVVISYSESLDSLREHRYQTFLDYPDATEKFKQHLYN